MSYRPICDTWILARSKVAYYGAYPAGFLGRARQLLGVTTNDPLLHICGGKVKDYPFYGLGPGDRTVDLDPTLKPDYLFDVRKIGREKGDIYPFPALKGRESDYAEVEGESALADRAVELTEARPNAPLWPAALIDRPYTMEDAEHYLEGKGDEYLPDINGLLKRVLSCVRPGGRVGVLDYFIPRPPKLGVRFVACVGVIVGFGNRGRFYTVYENDPNVGAKAEADEAPLDAATDTLIDDIGAALRETAGTPAGAPVTVEALAQAACVACGGKGKKSRSKQPCEPCGGTGRAKAPEAPALSPEKQALLVANFNANSGSPPLGLNGMPLPVAAPPTSRDEAALGGF